MGAFRPKLLLVFLAAALAYVPLGATYALRGEPNSDEGFYAYASYAVFHGRVPYRDFGYTQEPLLPYLQGTVLSVAGFGVRQERWLNVALGASSVGLAAVLWAAAGLPAAWGVLLALGWGLSRSLVYFDTIGKTYALSGFLLVAAAVLLLPGDPRRIALRWWVLSVLCVLSVGCRLTTAPAALVLGGGFALLYGNRHRLPALLGAPLLCTLVLIAPFYALDPANALFWTWDSHVMTMMPPRHFGTLWDSALLAPGAAVLAALALALAGYKALSRPDSDRQSSLLGVGFWILAAGLAGWAIPPFLSGVYAEYAIPGIPLVWVGSGLILAATFGRRRQGTGGRLGEAGLYATVIAAIATSALVGPSHILPGYLDSVDDAGLFAAKFSQRGDTVLTSMPEIALAADRKVLPRLESGNFGVTGEMSPQVALARHMLPFTELCDAVAAEQPRIVVLFSRNRQANFGWSLPSMRPIPEAQLARFIGLVYTRYEIVHSNSYFIVFRARGPLTPSPVR